MKSMTIIVVSINVDFVEDIAVYAHEYVDLFYFSLE